MFTGLVRSVGRVALQSERFAVKCEEDFLPLELGDSVAVDGVCLTVADFWKDGFLSDVSGETLSRTTLGSKARQSGFVNLEPALRLCDRLGGHLVSGHVDGLGQVLNIQELNNSWRLEIRWQDPDFGRYICTKASICLDGISLTVGGCSEKGAKFWVVVIPHTWGNTSLKYLAVGSEVNLEADLMAKYAESLLGGKYFPLTGNPANSSPEISTAWLAKHGWN